MTVKAETPVRGRAAHLGPERRRPQVLDTALDIAVEFGIGAVTIGAIADRMNVTRPVVYKCFADRVELIDELLQRESTNLLDGLIAALHQAKGPDPEAAFITGYTAMLHFIESRPGAWRLLFSADPDPSVAANFAEARQAIAHHSSRWIRPALESWWGKTDLDEKLPALIELFVASGEAAARTILDHESRWTADGLGEFYGRIMCQAFRAA